MEIINNTPEKLIIRTEANESLFNALRRSLDEVPTLAIDEVEIFKNDSALYDEVLAHRIGLIPIETDKKISAKTEIEMKLSKVGPCWVYSGDFKGGNVVHDKMPLTLLEEGQEIEIIATVRPGKGIEHAKYSPGLCYYRHLVSVKSKNAKVDKIIEESRGLVKPQKKGDTWVCDLNDAQLEQVEKAEGVVSDSDEVLMFIESFGQMEAKEILSKAVEALGENLDELEKAIK